MNEVNTSARGEKQCQRVLQMSEANVASKTCVDEHKGHCVVRLRSNGKCGEEPPRNVVAMLGTSTIFLEDARHIGYDMFR